MKLSKKQIIYGSVLTAAGIAYAIDAAFVGPPAAAHAAHVEAEAAVVATAKQAAGDSTAIDGPEHLLTTRLEKWASAHPTTLNEISDAFQASVVVKATVAEARPPQTQPTEDPSAMFSRRHRLIAIVLNSSGGYALVDGRILQVGQVIDDATLIGLTRRLARFSIAGRAFEVPLTADLSPDAIK